MTEKRAWDLDASDVTPKSVYLNRRKLLYGMAAVGGGALLAGRRLAALVEGLPASADTVPLTGLHKWPGDTKETVTPKSDVTTYNNFYEFGTGKADPSRNAGTLRISPWSVSVRGEVAKPRTFSMDELLKIAPLEERIYRHRCVEAWSIVVPWIGYPLSNLLKLVEPTEKAKYVAFQSFYDVHEMPLAPRAGIPFPYLEGLRLDEAMNPLALLTFGMYGETLPKQDGAPVRMVIPWKYGFKSIKSLVEIRLAKRRPPTTWNLADPHEYGFYSNVNPHVDHPRWSQKTERRLGEFFRRPTLMFNGYSDQVASMYQGMDLRKNF